MIFIENKFNVNEDLLSAFEEPKFSANKHGSHMFHESHHQTALGYMSSHHTGDDPPEDTDAPINAQNGLFPYYKAASSAKGPSLATWTRPSAADRLNFKPLLDQLTVNSGNAQNRDSDYSEDLNITYLICVSCNSLMTSLSYMRYIVGFSGTAEKNTHGCIIPNGQQPITSYTAAAASVGVKKAYRAWRKSRAANAVVEQFPTLAGKEDPIAPHIAYYLHLCLPFLDPGDPDVFEGCPNLDGSRHAARSTYTQLCWIILVIACIATLTEQGKTYGNHKLKHGIHQHLGVLDVYVSYFIWKLMLFDYRKEISKSGLDFVQWHQKYFWDAVHCPGINSIDHLVVGQTCYTTVQQNSRALVEQICEQLMVLYLGPLRPLVALVTGNLPHPAHLDSNQQFVKKFFIPIRAMKRLARLGGETVHALSFDTLIQNSQVLTFAFACADQGERL